MFLHPLTKFKIQKYYQNRSKFNNVFLRNNLPEMQNEAFVTNFAEYISLGNHEIALYENDENVAYLDSFGVEHIPKEIKTSRQLFTEYKHTIP